MDDVLVQLILTAGTVAVSLIGTYALIVKNNQKIKIDDATFIRSQILTKDEWQKLSDKQEAEHRQEISNLTAVHEERIRNILTLHELEKGQLLEKVKSLEARVDELEAINKNLKTQISNVIP